MTLLPSARRLSLVSAACALSVLISACSSVSNALSGDKVDYRSSGNTKTNTLEVPPDLSQLSGQGRYAQNSPGVVSASKLADQPGAGSPAANAATAVAPTKLTGVTLVREGQSRWLLSEQTPEQVWPIVREFWKDNGFELPIDQQAVGLMETDWNENRVKLPQDGIRNLIGKVLDNLYDSGERDKYRTRVERTAKGTEIYVTHRGMQEIFTDTTKSQTTWKVRPSDPGLEAEMLNRLMVKLGTPKEVAQAAVAKDKVAAGAPAASPTRVLEDGISVSVNGEFDPAWRRVGLALDRGGFTVEERDRSAGTYDVRLATNADTNKPGIIDRMTGLFSKKPTDTLTRYRLKLRYQGNGKSTVTVLNTDNQPASTAGGKEVARQLAVNLD